MSLWLLLLSLLLSAATNGVEPADAAEQAKMNHLPALCSSNAAERAKMNHLPALCSRNAAEQAKMNHLPAICSRKAPRARQAAGRVYCEREGETAHARRGAACQLPRRRLGAATASARHGADGVASEIKQPTNQWIRRRAPTSAARTHFRNSL